MAFPDSPVEIAIALVFALLVLATALILALDARDPSRGKELLNRIRTWWIIFAVLSVAIFLGRTATVVIMGLVSFLALKEFFTLIPTRQSDRLVLLAAYLAIPIQYALIDAGRYGIFIVFVPVYMLMAVPAVMVMRGETEGFLRSTATIHWGLMACVFAVGHAAALLLIDPDGSLETGVGLFLMLLLLTGLNDVAQYITGKNFGRTPISPTVSPNKTLEGVFGGVVITAWIAAMIGPFLGPFSSGFAALVGGGIAIVGFFGDLTLSGVKRDLGIKDSGSLLPGHGGILDRIDSLVFTAPLFFHVTRYFYF